MAVCRNRHRAAHHGSNDPNDDYFTFHCREVLPPGSSGLETVTEMGPPDEGLSENDVVAPLSGMLVAAVRHATSPKKVAPPTGEALNSTASEALDDAGLP